MGIIFASEVVQWSYTLAIHSQWRNKHRDEMECWNLSPNMTFMAAIMAGILSTMVMVWSIWTMVIDGSIPANNIICSLLSIGLHLSHIHFMALIARCVKIPITLWPPLSRTVSKYVICKTSYIGNVVDFKRRREDRKLSKTNQNHQDKEGLSRGF